MEVIQKKKTGNDQATSESQDDPTLGGDFEDSQANDLTLGGDSEEGTNNVSY